MMRLDPNELVLVTVTGALKSGGEAINSDIIHSDI